MVFITQPTSSGIWKRRSGRFINAQNTTHSYKPLLPLLTPLHSSYYSSSLFQLLFFLLIPSLIYYKVGRRTYKSNIAYILIFCQRPCLQYSCWYHKSVVIRVRWTDSCWSTTTADLNNQFPSLMGKTNIISIISLTMSILHISVHFRYKPPHWLFFSIQIQNSKGRVIKKSPYCPRRVITKISTWPEWWKLMDAICVCWGKNRILL